jgi:adenine-specific DNA-methyltransferase
MNSVEKNVIEQDSIQERNLALFLKNFPGVVSTGEEGELVINADKLKLALDPKARIEENGYELNWVGKKEAYHQAYAKQAKILQPLADDSKLNDGGDFLADSTQNLLIKGDNLQALKLLKASYFEQVKMIYIDPPYNTKSENFIYRDNFTASEDAILDELGYSADYKDYIHNIQGARTHSGWLSFMFPRLLLARDLLKDDGVIFISIDDNEQANLKLLCDEVFGEANFVANLIWKSRQNKDNRNLSGASIDHEYVICFQKNSQHRALKGSVRKKEQYSNPDDDSRGDWTSGNMVGLQPKDARPNLHYDLVNPTTDINYGCPSNGWRYDQNTMKKLIQESRILWPESAEGRPRRKVFLNEISQENPGFSSLVGEGIYTRNGTRAVLELFELKLFDFPKPVELIKVLLSQVLEKEDVVLDFFAGSGTTGQAVMELNAEDGGKRKFILVQLPEAIDAKKQKDAYEFVTQTLGKSEASIFEITAERLRRAGEKVKKDFADKAGIEALDIGFKAFALADDPMQQFYKPLHEVTPDDLAQLEIALSAETLEASLPTILVNLLLAEKLPVSTPIVPWVENALYQAANVLLIVNDLPIERIQSALSETQNRVEYVSIYSPNISGAQRDQFSQELKPALAQMGLDESRLRFRG